MRCLLPVKLVRHRIAGGAIAAGAVAAALVSVAAGAAELRPYAPPQIQQRAPAPQIFEREQRPLPQPRRQTTPRQDTSQAFYDRFAQRVAPLDAASRDRLRQNFLQRQADAVRNRDFARAQHYLRLLAILDRAPQPR